MCCIKICLIFLLTFQARLSIQHQSGSCIVTPLGHNATTTVLLPPLERVFSRKKRFLLMPPGGALKFTLSLSKRLLAAVPSGFTFQLESALYYPGASTRLELIPKRLRPKTTPAPKPPGPVPPLFVDIPGSLIRYKARPAIKPTRPQRIDVGTVQWVNSHHNGKYEYSNPATWTKWDKYASPQYQQKYAWTPQGNWTRWTNPLPRRRYEHRFHKPAYKWSTAQPYWYRDHSWPPSNRWYRALPEEADDEQELNTDAEFQTKRMHFPDLEPFEDWRHFHSHRERRQLFHQFEGLSKIFGLDMKSCILRAICESKRFLLPPGYSMIEDILRVVFTFPTISGLTDDYSQAMRSDYKECEKYLGRKCPFSMLSWLMNPGK